MTEPRLYSPYLVGIECPLCSAKKDDRCMTAGGYAVSGAHAARKKAARDAGVELEEIRPDGPSLPVERLRLALWFVDTVGGPDSARRLVDAAAAALAVAEADAKALIEAQPVKLPADRCIENPANSQWVVEIWRGSEWERDQAVVTLKDGDVFRAQYVEPGRTWRVTKIEGGTGGTIHFTPYPDPTTPEPFGRKVMFPGPPVNRACTECGENDCVPGEIECGLCLRINPNEPSHQERWPTKFSVLVYHDSKNADLAWRGATADDLNRLDVVRIHHKSGECRSQDAWVVTRVEPDDTVYLQRIMLGGEGERMTQVWMHGETWLTTKIKDVRPGDVTSEKEGFVFHSKGIYLKEVPCPEPNGSYQVQNRFAGPVRFLVGESSWEFLGEDHIDSLSRGLVILTPTREPHVWSGPYGVLNWKDDQLMLLPLPAIPHPDKKKD